MKSLSYIINKSFTAKQERTIISIFLTISILYFIFVCYTPFYGLNDDLQIEQILSGAYSTNGYFTYYLSTELSLFLHFLYKLFPNIPWLGIYYYLCYFICFFVFFYFVYKYSNSKFQKIMHFSIIYLLIFTLFSKDLIFTTYTLVATILGCAGILILSFAKSRSKYYSLIYFSLCYLTRENIFFMCLPFILFILIYIIYGTQTQYKEIIRYIMFFIALTLVLLFMNKAIYILPEYDHFVSFNDKRTSIYDYQGIPNYDNNLSFYERNNISRENFILYISWNHCLIENSVTDFDNFIKYNNNFPVNQSFKSILSQYKNIITLKGIWKPRYAPCNYIVLILYILYMFLILINKKWKHLLLPFVLFFIRSFLWLYLLYFGRYPDRVIMPLYDFEIIILISFILQSLSSLKITKLKNLILTILVAVLLSSAYSSLSQASSEYSEQRISYEIYSSLNNYMLSHSDCFYFKEPIAFNTEIELLFRTDIKRNSAYTGGWYDKIPAYNDMIKQFGEDNLPAVLRNNENVYLVKSQEIPISVYESVIQSKGILIETVEKWEIWSFSQ